MVETNFENLMGLAPQRAIDSAWEDLGASFPVFSMEGPVASESPANGKTFRAWEPIRKVLGKDVETVIQLGPDCVSMSMVNVAHAIQLIEISLGDSSPFQRYHPTFLYGVSRVVHGKNQLRGSGGSCGSWMTATVKQQGLVTWDNPNVPVYSSKLISAWGDGRDYNGVKFDKFLPDAKNRTIAMGSRVRTWGELRDAVCSGHLATISSSCGYKGMTPDKDGFHRPSGEWRHQMGIMGISDSPTNAWVAILNQWGPVHGDLIDFDTGEPWPAGTLRVRRDDFEKHHFTNSAEVFVFSGVDGFVERSDKLTGFLF